jgi:hypothetical protein
LLSFRHNLRDKDVDCLAYLPNTREKIVSTWAR